MRLCSDASLCTECRMCQLACSFVKTGEYSPRRALLRIDVRKEGLVSDPVVCRQCANALCMRACLFNAISRAGDGTVLIDEAKCTGCGRCYEACTYDVIVMRGKKAYKCDLCGGSPECVRACPTKALFTAEEVGW